MTRITNPPYRFVFCNLAPLVLASAVACGGGTGDGGGIGPQPIQDMGALIGPKGGEIAGPKGSALEGVKLVVPAGALSSDTAIRISAASSDVALPSGAAACGKQFQISPAGVQLAVPAQLTLPVDGPQVDLNDELTLRGKNIKPGLAFGLFTVQGSTLDANGKVDPTVPNFGLAWYQSDVEARSNGEVRVKVQTVLRSIGPSARAHGP